MASDEIQFRHVGLSSDGAVVFCEMDNGSTYSMPLCALDSAADWDAKAKPKTVSIIHDGFAAVVKFNTGLTIDFPSDFVLHVCEPSYTWYKDKGRAMSGVGRRIREIRHSRGLTLDALAAKCGIAKPNLSRLENDKVTPTLGTLHTIAVAMKLNPALLVDEENLMLTRHTFGGWCRSLSPIIFSNGWHRPGKIRASKCVIVPAEQLVDTFIAKWPEHRYARETLVKDAGTVVELVAEVWAQEQA